MEHSNVVSTVADGGRDWGTTATNTLESMTHQTDHGGLLKGCHSATENGRHIHTKTQEFLTENRLKIPKKYTELGVVVVVA